MDEIKGKIREWYEILLVRCCTAKPIQKIRNKTKQNKKMDYFLGLVW